MKTDVNIAAKYYKKDINFTIELSSKDLVRGLRPSSLNPRNSGLLSVCQGAIGEDGVLHRMEKLSRFATSVITDGFPYPQIFVFTNVIIVCGKTKIYEWDGSSLNHKLTVTEGGTWTAADYFDFVYLSNARVAVTRSADDYHYEVRDDLPCSTAICNFNGQTLVGAPEIIWGS